MILDLIWDLHLDLVLVLVPNLPINRSLSNHNNNEHTPGLAPPLTHLYISAPQCLTRSAIYPTSQFGTRRNSQSRKVWQRQ